MLIDESGGIEKMNNIQKPYLVLYKTFLFAGIPFLCIGVIFYFTLDSFAFIINGILWCLLAFICFLFARKDKQKFIYLKNNGICYQATILRIIPKNMIRIGSYVTVKFEIMFYSEKGKNKVLSDFYILSPFDKISNLKAEIYIYNARKYIYISRRSNFCE